MYECFKHKLVSEILQPTTTGMQNNALTDRVAHKFFKINTSPLPGRYELSGCSQTYDHHKINPFVCCWKFVADKQHSKYNFYPAINLSSIRSLKGWQHRH